MSQSSVKHVRDSRLICGALMLFGILITPFFLKQAMIFHALADRGQQTIAHVILETTGPGRRQMQMVFDIQGQQVQGWGEDLSTSHKVGDSIAILYDPKHPEHFKQIQELDLSKSV